MRRGRKLVRLRRLARRAKQRSLLDSRGRLGRPRPALPRAGGGVRHVPHPHGVDDPHASAWRPRIYRQAQARRPHLRLLRRRPRRLPGYGRLERGDVIVFNATFDERWDSVALNMYRGPSSRRLLPRQGRRQRLRREGGAETAAAGSGRHHSADPRQRGAAQLDHHRTARQPLQLDDPRLRLPTSSPREGMTMRIDRRNYLLYRKYIEWETGRKLEWTEAKRPARRHPPSGLHLHRGLLLRSGRPRR